MFRMTPQGRGRFAARSDARAAVIGPRFDGYPYLATRIGRSALRHIALVPADWSRDRIVALARAQAMANHLETAACFGLHDAVYVDADDADRTLTGAAPTGIPIVGRLHLAEPILASGELDVRSVFLKDFVRAVKPTGYVVGDGTARGLPATPADVERLGGRGADGLPQGLRRCDRCGEAVGEVVRGGDLTSLGEVVRVWCACDNHNRCARCGTPLAPQRLSAWFWSDTDDQAWHVAAYSAFSHRCPDQG